MLENLSGHSTQDILVKVTEDWKLALDQDEITFIDLCKAFDSIDHSLLATCKVICIWFDEASLKWFRSYFLPSAEGCFGPFSF